MDLDDEEEEEELRTIQRAAMTELNRRLIEHELGFEWLRAHAARPIGKADWDRVVESGRMSDAWFARVILGYTNSAKFSDLTVYWPPKTIRQAARAWGLGRLEALRLFELRASPRTRNTLDLDGPGAVAKYLSEDRKPADPLLQRLRQYPSPREAKRLAALFTPLSKNARRLLQLLGRREIVARRAAGSPSMPIGESYVSAYRELHSAGFAKRVPRPTDASERDKEMDWAQLTAQGREVARLVGPEGRRPRYIERELGPTTRADS